MPVNPYPVFSWSLNQELSLSEWERLCKDVVRLAEHGLPALLEELHHRPCPDNVWAWVWKKRQALFVRSHTPACQWRTKGALENEVVLEIMPGPHRMGTFERSEEKSVRLLRFAHAGTLTLSDELFYLPVVATIAHESQVPLSPWSFQACDTAASVIQDWLAWRHGTLSKGME